MTRLALPAGAALCIWFGAAGCAAETSFSEADRIAAFTAAGFSEVGGEYIRCDDTVTISRQAGYIEVVDLNSDGLPEAFVRESSTFCYGNTAEAFVLVTKDSAGDWRVLLDQVGIAVVTESGNLGWPDIEVGGPGFGPAPLFRFDGTQYSKVP